MKFYPAYTNGKPTFKREAPTAGAYLIKHNGQIRYVGYSAGNVLKTAYRHFQAWNDPIQHRVTFPKTARIAFVFTQTAERARQLERQWINKYGLNKAVDYLENTNIPRDPIFPDPDEPLPF